jgi:hypothetical protein
VKQDLKQDLKQDGNAWPPASRWWWALVMALLVAIALTLVVKLRPLLQTPVDLLARGPADCDLRQQGCTAEFADGGRLRLGITPAGIPLVQPLDIEVRLIGIEAPTRVEVDFSGLDMDMGYNRFPLDAAGETGLYRGGAMLPVCVRNRMLWEARVILFAPEQIRAAAFRFETRRSD